MYSMSVCGGGRYTSAQLMEHLAAIYDPGRNLEVFAMMCSIENLEARGIRYSHHDGDLLGAAWDLIVRHYTAQLDALKARCAGRVPTADEWTELHAIEAKLASLSALPTAVYNLD